MTNKSKYDSEFCGSLPLHLINLIQPYGVLVVVDKDSLGIVQVSENAKRIFNASPEEIVKTTLADHLNADAVRLLRDRDKTGMIDKIPTVWDIGGKSYLTLIHPKDDMFLVEIDVIEYNSSSQSSFVTIYQEIKYAMGLIQAAKTLGEVVQIAARELKRISEFDKVMIYRFDKDWNGTVIAEEKEPEMDS